MATSAFYNPIDPANLYNVDGQIAVVTGGGTGIGLLIATSLENNGATVYIIGRRLEALEKAARENSRHGKIIPLQGDITSRESLLSMVETIKARHGYIDLLINNAGISRNLLPQLPSPSDCDHKPGSVPSIKAFQDVLWDTGSPLGFGETFETNVTAVYFTTVAFLELLHLGNIRRGFLPPSYREAQEQRHARGDLDASSLSSSPSVAYHSLPPTPPSPYPNLPGESDKALPTTHTQSVQLSVPLPTSQVITISSSGSFRLDARVLSVSYTLAKCACTHLGRLMANLLSEWGIRSNILAPGVWPSEMTTNDMFTPAMLARGTPMGRVGTLTDMAGPILFLASRAGAYVNAAVWLVDGGRVGSVASTY